MGKTLTFYILFELRLIPTLFIVFLYGYQPEKLQASMYLLLYTVLSSLPLLIIFINSSTFLFFFSPDFFLLIWFANHFRFHSQNPNIPGPCLTSQSSRRSSCSRVHSTSRYFAQTRQLRIAHFLSLIRKQGSHFIP